MNLRLFFAFEIPTEIRSLIDRRRKPLIMEFPKSRWVRPEAQHLTLSFLGDTPSENVERILDAVASPMRGLGEISISLERAGFFPNEQHPKVAWIGGTSDRAGLAASALAKALNELQIPVSKKPWMIHLTQARFSRPWPPDVIRRFKSWAEELPKLEFSTEEILLYSSLLRPGGAVYSVEGRLCLK